jgi:hypothetical protein
MKLNLKKCEIFKLNDPDDHEIIIAETRVSFAWDLSYIKYLGVPIGSKRIAKKKFAEVKLQKLYSELDKLESSNLSINQKLKVIRNIISPQMNYIYSNSYVLKVQTHNLDKRIHRVINQFLGGQKLSKTYIHSPIKKGGLEIPLAIQEMNAYRIHHVVRLLLNVESRKIMKE